ncbi:MAG: hypothetical protein JWN94_3873 [Betaproteobacteria bacterium]|nr:hypothetical protein [Betaproteobacteria bacterium]
MNRRRFACLLALVVLLVPVFSGCTSIPRESADDDVHAKRFSTRPDKANIYLYRDELLGFAIAMTVAINGRKAGQTVGQTFLRWEVDPGTHEIASYTEDIATLKLNAEAGKSYYVWQEVKLGFWSAQSMLHEVDESQGRQGVVKCRLVKSDL